MKLILGAFGKPNFHWEYLQNYNEPMSNILTIDIQRYSL